MSLYNLLDTMISKLNKSVKIEEQTLTDAEKLQARTNINASSKNDLYVHNLLYYLFQETFLLAYIQVVYTFL